MTKNNQKTKTRTFKNESLNVSRPKLKSRVSTYTRPSTKSLHMVVGLFLLRVRLPGTACAMNCVNRCQLRTVSDSYLNLVCLLSTSAYSALQVLHIMRYINLLTYLLTREQQLCKGC